MGEKEWRSRWLDAVLGGGEMDVGIPLLPEIGEKKGG